jgi:hypothetical protein
VPAVVEALRQFRWEPTEANEARRPAITEFRFEFKREQMQEQEP